MNQRTVDPLALSQLAAWETVARGWPVRFIFKANDFHLCCGVCSMTLMPVEHQHQPYTACINNFLAAMVAHLRDVHRDIEGEVYKGDRINGRQNPQAATGNRTDSDRSSSNTDLD